VQVHWADDLITAGVTTAVGGLIGYFAATHGARIGASATRDATTKSLEEQRRLQQNHFERETAARNDEIERARDVWRRALWHECVLNVRLNLERSGAELWSYDTRVLGEAHLRAAAFSAEVLERIRRSRIANERLESYLEELRPRRVQPGIEGSQQEDLKDLRKALMVEIDEIEKALRI
jgi:hypothetical protein